MFAAHHRPTKIYRKHIVLTKSEQQLHKKLISARVKLSKCRKKINKQKTELLAAKNFFMNSEFLKHMENWSTTAKLFTLMQFREIKKKGKGRRFSEQDKIIGLTMLKQSPKAYRFMRKHFILPSQHLSKCYTNVLWVLELIKTYLAS